MYERWLERDNPAKLHKLHCQANQGGEDVWAERQMVLRGCFAKTIDASRPHHRLGSFLAVRTCSALPRLLLFFSDVRFAVVFSADPVRFPIICFRRAASILLIGRFLGFLARLMLGSLHICVARLCLRGDVLPSAFTGKKIDFHSRQKRQCVKDAGVLRAGMKDTYSRPYQASPGTLSLPSRASIMILGAR